MSLPGVTMTIEDGALGTLPPNIAGASAKIGVCSKGTPNRIGSFSDINTLKRTLGSGPLVEAIAAVLNVAGGPVYGMPVTVGTAGTVGANGTGGGTTHTGTGAGTVAVSLAPDRQILAKIGTGGILGTSTIQFSIDGGEYTAPVATAANMSVPGAPLVALTLASGTYVADEVYTVATSGTVTQTGAGPAITKSASPVDAYVGIVEIVTAGGLGVGSFTYSLDNGNSASAVISIPSGAGKYAIPGTGVVLTFAGTFVEGDTYTFKTIPGSFTTSNVTDALDALHGEPVEWDHVHIVGAASSAANAYTMASAVNTKIQGMKTDQRFVYAVVECPTTESDSAVAAAFANFAPAEGRVVVAAGDADMVSAITGRVHRRNAAWAATARIASVPEEENPGWNGAGALTGVVALYRDERKSQFLDEQRFLTLRTVKGKQGYFVTDFRTMAQGGSDFAYGMNLRVMNLACRIALAAETDYVNQDVLIDTKTGFIDEKEAQMFEATVNSKLRAGVVSPGHATKSSVVMSRTANILAGEAAPVAVRVVPKGYLKHIETSIGFANPAVG